jgi:hypothetical protein
MVTLNGNRVLSRNRTRASARRHLIAVVEGLEDPCTLWRGGFAISA